MKILVTVTWLIAVLLGLIGIGSLPLSYTWSQLSGIAYIALTGFTTVLTLIKLDQKGGW